MNSEPRPVEPSKAAGQSTPVSQRRLKQKLVWLFGGLLAVGVLSMTASFAPPMMKRLFVYYAIYGLACGLVLEWLDEEIGPGFKKMLPVWGCLLAILGAANLGWLSYQHFRKAREEYAAAHPRDPALQAQLEKLSENDPELKARYDEERRRTQPLFPDYLSHRVTGLGELKSPWPEMIWGLELLGAGAICAGTIYIRRRPASGTSTSPGG